jgi:hypothetical protein
MKTFDVTSNVLICGSSLEKENCLKENGLDFFRSKQINCLQALMCVELIDVHSLWMMWSFGSPLVNGHW